MHVVDAEFFRNREHQGREQQYRRQAFEQAAHHQKHNDGDCHETDPATGQIGHEVGQLLRHARLRDHPGHRQRRAENDQDRAGERGSLDQHAVELAQADAAIHEDAGEYSVKHREGRDLGCRRHPATDRTANQKRQQQRRSGNDQGTANQRKRRALGTVHLFVACFPASQ